MKKKRRERKAVQKTGMSKGRTERREEMSREGKQRKSIINCNKQQFQA